MKAVQIRQSWFPKEARGLNRYYYHSIQALSEKSKIYCYSE